MKHLNIRLTLLHPSVVTRGTSKDDSLCSLLFYFFQIVPDERFGLFFHPRSDQGKSATPFFSSQNGEIDPGLIQDLHKSLRDFLCHRIKGGNTSNEIDDLRLLFL